jgi:hypothetical protein
VATLGTVGPLFFVNDGETVTVTADRYIAMLQNVLLPQMEALGVYSNNFLYFQQQKHCATSRQVAGSIADGVIAIFHLYNHSGRTTTLGSTQPLTEMSTRNTSWGVKAAGA